MLFRSLRLPLWGCLGLAGTASIVAFVLIASALFLTGTGLWGAYSPWWWAFPEYLLYARDEPTVWDWLEASAGASGGLLLLVTGIIA